LFSPMANMVQQQQLNSNLEENVDAVFLNDHAGEFNKANTIQHTHTHSHTHTHTYTHTTPHTHTCIHTYIHT